MPSKRGLPVDIRTRHDLHYVEELAKSHRSVGKIIAIGQIEPNPEQPRTEFGDLSELTSSIREQGVLEPLLVKPVRNTGKYMIIAGERRWRAANLAGLREVPCIELDIDEKTVAEIALIENLQRKDLTIWEEADGLKALADKFHYTHEEISKRIGKSRTTVTESMAIAGIPQKVREKCAKAGVSAKSSLLEVARQFDDKAMMEFVDSLQKGGVRRDEIRQKARAPRVPKEAPEAAEPPSPKTRFSFNSARSGFRLEIVFDHEEKYDRKEVLQALKEVFDHVKLNR